MYSIPKLCIQNNLPNVKISAFFYIQIRTIHGSGWFSFGPNPLALGGGQRDLKPTTNINRLSRFWVWVVLRLVLSVVEVAKIYKCHQNQQKNHRILLWFGRIWLNLTKSSWISLDSSFDLVEVGWISYITSVGSGFGEENPPLYSLASILGGENLLPTNRTSVWVEIG